MRSESVHFTWVWSLEPQDIQQPDMAKSYDLAESLHNVSALESGEMHLSARPRVGGDSS